MRTPLSIDDIHAAASRLCSVLDPTPLRRSWTMERLAGNPVYLKLECIQPTGSFKIRGALGRMLALSPGRRGVITASSGNHGAAVAMAAKSCGVGATVVVPLGTAPVKVQLARMLGADVVFQGRVYDEAEEFALSVAADRDLEYVHAFADRQVIASQGTVALEILARIDRPGAIVVPVGGGGLISGIAVATRALSPSTSVIGVQPRASRAMYESFRAGRMVDVAHLSTLSDATVGGVSSMTLEIVRGLVDDVVVVGEDDIGAAMRVLVFDERLVVEGAGALAAAALISGALPPRLTGPVVLVVSGSNVDLEVLAWTIGAGEGPLRRGNGG